MFKLICDNSTHSKPLSDFVTIKHGYAFKGEYITFDKNNVVLVTPGNFRIGGGFQEEKCKYFTSSYPKDYILHPGDLIITMTDLSKEADTLGYSALVPHTSNQVYLHNQRIGLVQLTNDILTRNYIYWYLRSYEYRMHIVGSASGSTVKHTSPKRILEQNIPIPSEEDMEKLYILEYLDNLVAHNNAENIQLVQTRDALLPKLMSGELDTSNIQL